MFSCLLHSECILWKVIWVCQHTYEIHILADQRAFGKCALIRLHISHYGAVGLRKNWIVEELRVKKGIRFPISGSSTSQS